MTLSYEQAIDLLPAYAIGALEAEEKAAVDEYLRLQKELINSLTRAEAATTLLAQGVDQASVAPDAQARMMERINTDVSMRGLTTTSPAVHGSQDDSNRGHANTQDPQLSSAAAAAQTMNGHGRSNQRERSSQKNGLPANAIQRRAPSGRGESGKSGPPSRRPAGVQRQRVVSGRPRQRPPMDLFPPPPKRKFMGGIFGTRALINATMVASLVTLLFMSLLNLQSETQLRQLATEVNASNARLVRTETQVSELNQANVDLSKANSELISQSSTFIDRQADLTERNLALSMEMERVQATRTEMLTELNKIESENREISIERAALFEENARLENQVEANLQRLELLSAATQTTILFGTDEAPSTQATFIERDSEAALVVSGLEPLPANQIYQVWLVTNNGQQVSAGLFEVDEDKETTWAALEIPRNAQPYSLIGVSVEPVGGSDEPTGAMFLESIPIINDRPDNIG